MKGKISNIIKILVLALFIISSIYFIICINKFGIIPNKYLVIVYIVMFILLLMVLGLVTRKNIILYLIGIILSLFISALYLVGTNYINTLNGTINKVVNNKITSVNYYILVKKNSNINDISDLKDKKIGYIEDSNSNKVVTMLLDKVKCDTALYTDYNTILSDFNNNVPIILNSGYVEALGDEISNFNNTYKIIYTFTIKDSESINSSDYKDISSEPFLIYLSGIDTYGEISTRSRSDVNILIVVNPKTHKILLVNTPRDYYVQLHGTTGLKDKLTHAGIYGIEKSVTTIEDLYDVDINHYVRVNFNTLIQLVDEIGGIDITSDTAFIAHTNKSVVVQKGLNHFNGKEALAYSRERYAYTSGDRHRGQNQQQVITAIINKVTSTKTLISNYNEILNTLSNSFETDLDNTAIKSFAKMQLDKNISWDIESISVDGTGSKNYTYSMGNKYLLYVMIPDDDSVNNAKGKIKEVLNEK